MRNASGVEQRRLREELEVRQPGEVALVDHGGAAGQDADAIPEPESFAPLWAIAARSAVR